MMVRNLSDKEKDLIVQALEKDGFQKIVVHDNYISFTKYPREYELYGLDIWNSAFNDDVGLNIMLQEEKIFESLSTKKDFIELSHIKNFHRSKNFKARHTVSIKNKMEEASDFEEAVNAISKWSCVRSEEFYHNKEGVYSIPTISSILLVINIKGKIHIALNHDPEGFLSVYEDTPDIIESLVKSHPETFFDAPALEEAIRKIREDKKDQ